MQIGQATDVANRFVEAAEKFLAAVLNRDGSKFREVVRTGEYADSFFGVNVTPSHPYSGKNAEM